MATPTTHSLTALFSTIQRQHRDAWTLPEPDTLARIVANDADLQRSVTTWTRELLARRIDFTVWQQRILDAIAGVDVTLLAAGAALGLLGSVRVLKTHTQPANLTTLEAQFSQRVVNLTRLLASGRISVDAWRAAFLRELAAYHPAAAIAGAGGSRDAAVQALGRERFEEQAAYLNAWADSLLDAELPSERALTARAQLYAGAGWGTAERAKAAALGITLPVQPGDGRCRGRCRCYWRIVPEGTGYRCSWISRDDDGTCVDCATWGVMYADYFVEAGAA